MDSQVQAPVCGRMGRPPLGESADDTKKVHVRMDADLRARVETARGDQKMAEFIREAVERELQRREGEGRS